MSLHTRYAILSIGCMLLSYVVAGRGASLGAVQFFIWGTVRGVYNDDLNKPIVFKLTSFLSYPTAIYYGFLLMGQYGRLGKYT